MLTKKHILNVPAANLTQVNDYFKKHTNIDYPEVPKKYGMAVNNAYDFLIKDLEILALLQSFEISEIHEDHVLLCNGESFLGEMPGRILKDSKQVLCFVVTIRNFDDKSHVLTASLENYFLDIWGTAFIENAERWLKDYIAQELAELTLKRTHVWSPGQHQFELKNQRCLFNLLAPEEIGMQLAPSMKMSPIKSVSGIMGVLNQNQTNDLNPCDFCSLHKSCRVSGATCS